MLLALLIRAAAAAALASQSSQLRHEPSDIVCSCIAERERDSERAPNAKQTTKQLARSFSQCALSLLLSLLCSALSRAQRFQLSLLSISMAFNRFLCFVYLFYCSSVPCACCCRLAYARALLHTFCALLALRALLSFFRAALCGLWLLCVLVK